MDRSHRLNSARAGTLSCVSGVELGHWQDPNARTGCSVVLLPEATVGGYDLRGGAPASRELALLEVTSMQPFVDAFVLTGGSALGLACADGVVQSLREMGRGFPTDQGPIPLVAGAALYDLGTGSNDAPGAEHGRKALSDRNQGATERRSGAGAGAMVGKVRGRAHAMDGGLGQAGVVLEDGLQVAALVAVNALGDVVHPATGEILAGALDDSGEFLDCARFLGEGSEKGPSFLSNTVLSVVVTNASLTKAETTRVARMAHCGIARTVSPCATSLDGDIVFAAATGQHEASADRVGTIAAEVLAAAVLNAVTPNAEAAS